MFINVYMIEPVTASVCLYLLTSPKINYNKKILLYKKPKHIKKNICKWYKNNKHTIFDITIDEFSDYIADSKILNMIKINPTIPMILYIIIVVLIILF